MTDTAVERESWTDRSLEELLSRAAGCLESEHDALWLFGDLTNEAIEQAKRNAPDPRTFRRARAALYRRFASLQKSRTTNFVRQHAERSGTFGVEQRFPDVGFSLYRAVLNAAQRIKQDARHLLDDALAKAWTVGDLNAMGVEPKAITELRAECGDCQARVHIVLKQTQGRSFVGLPLRCPVCAAVAAHDGGDVLESATLGALEAAA